MQAPKFLLEHHVSVHLHRAHLHRGENQRFIANHDLGVPNLTDLRRSDPHRLLDTGSYLGNKLVNVLACTRLRVVHASHPAVHKWHDFT